MFIKMIILFCLLLSVQLPVFAVSNNIIIYSYKVAGEKTTDEFVELRNISSENINIIGWQLAKKTASGSKYNLITEFPSAEIRPNESLIIGHKDSTENPDIYYSTDYSISEDNSIILFSDSGKTIVDKVGFGKSSDFETKPAPSAKNNIWYRKNTTDTDNNYYDFYEKQIINNKDYSGLCLTEIMPSPEDGKEWFEIYNSEVSKDISGLIISDKLGSIKKYTVPEGINISEGQYMVFYSDKTGISLNNDGDGLVLIDGMGVIFDDSGTSFGASKKGYSYAFNGEKWQWTKTPTPAAKNIITYESITDTLGAVMSQKKTEASDIKIKTKKGTVPSAEVMGSQNEPKISNIFDKPFNNTSPSDKMLGIIFIGVAIFSAFAYTLYVNKEKIFATFNIEREGYEKYWRNLWQKMQRWRSFSIVRRARRWKDSICKRVS